MNRKKDSRGDTVAVPFHFVASATLLAAAATITVSPVAAISPRLAALADDFDEYRFTKLRFRLHPAGTGGSAQVASYQPGIVDTPPSTLAQNSESLQSTVLGSRTVIPSSWYSVDGGVLAGMHPWYKTIPGTPEASEELQGGIYITGTGTDLYTLEISGVCVFRAAIAAGNTPLDRALAHRRREKLRIMSLLSDTTATSALRK